MIPIAENTPVRVIGKVRTLANQRSVVAFTVIPLKNLNEMTMHMLEVAHCKLFFGKVSDFIFISFIFNEFFI